MFVDEQFYRRHGLPVPTDTYNAVAGVLCFMKDTQGRFVFANNNFMAHFGLNSASELFGCTDHDIMTTASADRIRNDDLLVLSGKSAILPRFEQLAHDSNRLSQFNTRKSAVFGREGDVIGIKGVVKDLDVTPNYVQRRLEFKSCINYIQSNIYNPPTIPALAERFHMSVSQFERKFKVYYEFTPLKFINGVRMDYACRSLIQGHSISRVSNDLGYCDQSYFTKIFKSVVGVTPKKYTKCVAH